MIDVQLQSVATDAIAQDFAIIRNAFTYEKKKTFKSQYFSILKVLCVFHPKHSSLCSSNPTPSCPSTSQRGLVFGSITITVHIQTLGLG